MPDSKNVVLVAREGHRGVRARPEKESQRWGPGQQDRQSPHQDSQLRKGLHQSNIMLTNALHQTIECGHLIRGGYLLIYRLLTITRRPCGAASRTSCVTTWQSSCWSCGSMRTVRKSCTRPLPMMLVGWLFMDNTIWRHVFVLTCLDFRSRLD